jgi:hypothetical protein
MQRIFIVAMTTGLIVLTVMLLALVSAKRDAGEPSPRQSIFSS